MVTLPGFLAPDVSMRQMRHNLRAAGFHAAGWGQGINRGARAEIFPRLAERVDALAQRHGRPVHLVGWSLGGVLAREFAKRTPDAVASVVTMGSPFSGSRRANNAWRLYRLVAGHSVDAPPVPFDPAPKPPVPTYALWSRRDGVIAPACARGLPEESDHAIELDCRHMSFAYSHTVIETVMVCLLEAEGRRAGQP